MSCVPAGGTSPQLPPKQIPSLSQGIRAPEPDRLHLSHREAPQPHLRREGDPRPLQGSGHHQPGGSGLPAKASQYGVGLGVHWPGAREGTRGPPISAGCGGVAASLGLGLGLPIPLHKAKGSGGCSSFTPGAGLIIAVVTPSPSLPHADLEEEFHQWDDLLEGIGDSVVPEAPFCRPNL